MNRKGSSSVVTCRNLLRGRTIKQVIVMVALVLVCSAIRAQAAPTITGTLVNGTPSNVGPVGATLTIQGSGFGQTIGFSTATLNGNLLAGPGVQPKSWSDTSIVVVIPISSNSGPIIVTVQNVQSNPYQFYIGPVLVSVSPPSALAGQTVTITGAGLGTIGGTITFNGQNANYNGWTDGSIHAQVPDAATAGPIVATVAGQASNGIPFTPTPNINQLLPSSGNAGDSITIGGYSFGNQQGSSTVTFNGVNATVNSWTNTSISVLAPSSATTGNVVVTVNGFPSAGVVFTYTPSITGLSPNPVLADETVTISGNNFGNSSNGASVTFNGVNATINTWGNQSISVIEPGSALPGPVVVTVNGVPSNGFPFSYTAAYAFNLGYTPNGDLRTANDTVNGNWTFTYDDFNRVSTARTSSQGFSYVYDQYGNRWQQNVTTGQGPSPQFNFSIGNQIVRNQIVGAPASCTANTPFCYDAAGNLLNDGTHSYVYDAENRIVQVDGGAATYAYDANGQRIQKINGGLTAEYLYDLSGRLITEVSGTGVWTRGEVFAAGRHLATYASGTTYLVQSDWLGTERARVLPNGDQFETCVSLPFGDGQTCTGAGDPSPNHLTGKQRDGESNLDNFGFRYYGSSQGRFMSPDEPLYDGGYDDPQELNLYSYVRNNPLNSIDPDGHGVTICDTDHQNCVSVSDQDYAQAQQQDQYNHAPSLGQLKGPWNAEASGNITGSNGKVVGTVTWERDDPPGTPVEGITPLGERYLGQYAIGAGIGRAISGIWSGISGLFGREAENAASETVNLADQKATSHILDGDATGGGHAPGVGIAGKSEFPAGWGRDKIMHEISDVATDPASKVTQAGRSTIVEGTREGVNIRVVIRDGRIVTGYPTNLPRNP